MNKKKIIIIITGLVLARLVVLVFTGQSHSVTPTSVRTPVIKINGATFELEIADTDATREAVLSNRQSLAQNAVMLFIFETIHTPSFWMKNMQFPLDIIWIAGDIVVGIDENLPAEGGNPLQIYTAPQPADKVLEINAGVAKSSGIKVGDPIVISY